MCELESEKDPHRILSPEELVVEAPVRRPTYHFNRIGANTDN